MLDIQLIPKMLCQMISFPFYSLRPFSIPQSITIITQYHGPNTWDQHFWWDTMVQNHRFKYQGLNTMDQKISFPTCTHFSLHESACIRIRAFWTSIPRVYATLLRGTCVYIFFLHSKSLNCDLTSEWVSLWTDSLKLPYTSDISSVGSSSYHIQESFSATSGLPSSSIHTS